MNDPTAITHTPDAGTTFTGDAVTLYVWVALKVALGLYIRSGMIMARGDTITKMMGRVTAITRKSYPRGKPGQVQALADLQKSIDTLHAAIPVVSK